MLKIHKGNIIFTPTMGELTIVENGYIVVENGIVREVLESFPQGFDGEIINHGDNLIIPGFVDLHFHAPQFENQGLGLDYELLPWLEKYTFVEEAKFSDIKYAKQVYLSVIKKIWAQGTTRIIFFGTVHKESTKILLDLLGESGLGGFVGKVNMDRNSPETLIESTQSSLKDTEDFFTECSKKHELVKPIVTPRFAPSCTAPLMDGLGKLAQRFDAPIQTHLSENSSEIEWVKSLHPDCEDYLNVYEKYGLIGKKTIFAHCVYNTEKEIELLKSSQSFIAHCPSSNYNLSSGIMPLRKYIDLDMNIGLGTDIGAGHQTSIKDTMVAAIQGSKLKWVENKEYAPVNIKEALYLATKGGGKFFGKVGSFEKGYDFDALIIDDTSLGIVKGRNILERLSKFIYIGDDRNIVKRYVRGNIIEM